MPLASRGVRLIVLRHGPAVERDPARWPDDTKRPLTPEGAAATRKAAKGLVRYIGHVDRIVTSDAVRCRVTAEVVRAALERPPILEGWKELAPGLLAQPIFSRLARNIRSNQKVLVVGHEPTLAEFLGVALVGEGTPFVRLGKGAAACVDFPRGIRPGAGVLRWLATRKQLARAG
ncbi:MAG: SixA phosphatase family protein [Thermoplasmata archaeon]